jgi:RND family efflux transporter MFP subunit
MSDDLDISALRIDRSSGQNKNKRPYLKWVLIVGLFTIIIAVALFFFISSGFFQPEVELVPVVQTRENPQSTLLTASGYVVAQRKAAIASKGTGRLEYLAVEEGDRVTKGQLIARLDASDVEAALGKAHAELSVARADSSEAALTLQRQLELDKLNLTDQANVDAARTGYARVMAAINSAQAGVRVAEVAVENTIIYAPFNGTVLTKDADVGEIVAPFAASANSRGTVVTIADMGSLEVEADVSESNITLVELNQPCEIILDAYPQQRYPGYVKKIVPTADRGKATVMTKVAFQELDDRVLPEMSAKVNFLSDESETVYEDVAMLTLPSSSLVNRNDTFYVLQVKDGVIEEQSIERGKSVGNRFEIIAGVQINDRVVRNPHESMKPGTKVRIKQ